MEWYELLGLLIAFYLMHKENQSMFKETQKEIGNLRNDLSTEMKDFHGRLCVLEEKYIQMMERFMQDRK